MCTWWYLFDYGYLFLVIVIYLCIYYNVSTFVFFKFHFIIYTSSFYTIFYIQSFFYVTLKSIAMKNSIRNIVNNWFNYTLCSNSKDLLKTTITIADNNLTLKTMRTYSAWKYLPVKTNTIREPAKCFAKQINWLVSIRYEPSTEGSSIQIIVLNRLNILQ